MTKTAGRGAKRLLAGLGLALLAGTSAHAQGVTTIKFWNNWDGNRAEQLNQVLARFEAANPGIKVENVTLTSSTTTQRMIAAVASGAVPDLYMLNSNDVAQWASLGAVRALDDYVARDKLDLEKAFFTSSVEGSRFDGELILLPFKIPTPLAIWYNRELFEEAGLDPDSPPKTWQELEAAATALTKREGDVIRQLGLNICANCNSAAELAFNEWLSRNGGSLLNADSTDVAFDSPEGIETLQWMVDFSKNTTGGWNNVVGQFGNTFPDMRPAFYSGKVAMMMDGPWLYNIAAAEAPGFVDKIDVFVLPVNSENPNAKSRYLAYGVPGYGIPVNAAHPDQAWELLKFITMEQDGACAFFQMLKRPDSPMRDCQGGTEPRLAEALSDNLALVEAAVSPPGFPEINKRLQAMQEAVLLGNESVADGIARAAADVRAILASKR